MWRLSAVSSAYSEMVICGEALRGRRWVMELLVEMVPWSARPTSVLVKWLSFTKRNSDEAQTNEHGHYRDQTPRYERRIMTALVELVNMEGQLPERIALRAGEYSGDVRNLARYELTADLRGTDYLLETEATSPRVGSGQAADDLAVLFIMRTQALEAGAACGD
ncbi:hypothetical protein Tco_0000134 [Tanacetum coccineum]